MRPSSTRTEEERITDITLTWIEEWLRDIHASIFVIHGIVDKPGLSFTLSSLEAPLQDLLDGTEKLIEKVEKS